MSIDSAAFPFVAIAAVPALVSVWLGPMALTIALLTLPIVIGLFFRDPERRVPAGWDLVLSPADGRVMHAGLARPGEAPAGAWLQITIFLSVLDVHINRTPVAGRVERVIYNPGSYLPAFRHDSWRNEHSEIWLDHGGVPIVVRQVVGLLARRVVCRVKPAEELEAGQRIGLMKFGSRMDVFVPVTATVQVKTGDKVRGGETVVAHLSRGDEHGRS